MKIIEGKIRRYAEKIVSVFLCLGLLYVLYKGCYIKQVIFFQNLPGTTVKTNVTFSELCNEFQEQKKDNFAYIDPQKAIAYEIKENQEYIEYVKIYVITHLHGLTSREYTIVYHPMFILSLNESNSYVYQNKKMKKFDHSLTLSAYGQEKRNYRTGWNFNGIIVDIYTFYPVQNNSVTREMSEHMPYYFQLRIEGF